MKVKYLLILCTLLFSGCQLVMKTVYGVHSPRVIKTKQLLKYCNKYKIDTASVLLLPDYKAFQYKFSKLKSVNNLAIFNSEGHLLVRQEQIENDCPGHYSDYISIVLDSHSYTQRKDSLNLDSLLTGLVKLNLKPAEFTLKKPFIAVIYSAHFVGKLNKHYTLNWNMRLKERKNVQLINIICDPNENWTKSDVRKIKK